MSILWQSDVMRVLRHSLRDNQIATTFIAIICAFLMLQGMLSGFSRSAMADTEYENIFGVICSTDGAGHAFTQGDDGQSPQKMNDCPCASLCRLASGTLQALLTPDFIPVVQKPLMSSRVRYSFKTITAEISENYHSEARAPPFYPDV
ncbi:DUF2946 family protein [Brucella sp. H1_1004]|uniref:DUF2946 family protein n=1 Tax=Brucella sp. H1_1004 TaxID=3110109 RepID=UPI0039B6B197